MAKWQSDPEPWDDSMSDGCTGVLDKYPWSEDASPDCVKHDKACYYGGGVGDFLKANWQLSKDHWKRGPTWKVLAPIRFLGTSILGLPLWNWKGPGLPDGE